MDPKGKTVKLLNWIISISLAVVLPPLVGSSMAQQPADEITKTESLIADAWKIQHRLRNDPHRPRYHFMPPMAWMNDINGSIFWKGNY
jgi:sucrose-6-phosphate hydrolase SacC (GH32 family)